MGMPLGLQVFSHKVELDKLEFWPENEMNEKSESSRDYSPSIKWLQLLLWGVWMCVEDFMAILPTVAETFHSKLQLFNGGTKRKSHQINKVNNICHLGTMKIYTKFCANLSSPVMKNPTKVKDSSSGGHESIISWQSMWQLLGYFSKNQTSINFAKHIFMSPFIMMNIGLIVYFESVPHTPSCCCQVFLAHQILS